MAKTSVSATLRYIRSLFSRQEADGQSDQHLLEQFVSQHDEAAFSALLQRHGAMAMGVCMRILHDEHLAEDALQATFLVLAVKAGTLRVTGSLAGWLHGVALRLARKVKSEDLRLKRQLERENAEPTLTMPMEASRQEEKELLDEELQRLPDKYRQPLLLCYFEGHTQEQAAVKLGCTPGQVKGRLDRGRERLRFRLIRRGVSLSAAGVATALGETGQAATGLSPLLATSTVSAAMNLVSGKSLAACGVSALVVTLVKGGLIMGPKKALLILMSAFLAIAIGAGIWAETGRERLGGEVEAQQVASKGDKGKKDATQKPNPKDDLQAVKTRLAELKKAIAVKEKELADMRAEADALDRRIEGTPGKVYTKVADLFKDMPEEAYPRTGLSGGPERAAAIKWCKANLVGRTIEWTTEITAVKITGDGPFKVTLGTQGKKLDVFDKDFFLGEERCWAILRENRKPHKYPAGGEIPRPISYDGCSEAEAKKLRDLKGNKVKCRATLLAVDVGDRDVFPVPNLMLGGIPFTLRFGTPTIDGFLPEASKTTTILRAEADAPDLRIQAKVYTKVEELFHGMPKEAYPKAGPSAGLERAAARKWCKANLVGRTIEWTTNVAEVEIAGDGPFEVTLKTEARQGIGEYQPALAYIFDKMFSLGEQKCYAALGEIPARPLSAGATPIPLPISYKACTEAEAKKLRDFKGKQVKCRAILLDVDVGDREESPIRRSPGLLLVLRFGPPTVDGFLPEASKTTTK